MTQPIRTLLLLLATALMLLAAGCGDKKTTTSKNNYGDITSDQFEALLSGVEGANEMQSAMVEAMVMAWDNILHDASNPHLAKTIDTRTPMALHDSVPIIEFTKTYRTGTQDWKFDFTVMDVHDADTHYVEIVDSMKFFHGSNAVEWPSADSVTQVVTGMALEITESHVGLAKVLHGGVFAGHKWTITGDAGQVLTQGAIVLAGTGYSDIESDFEINDDHDKMVQDIQHTPCHGLFDFEAIYNALDMNLHDVRHGSCPGSGSMVLHGDCEVACGSGGEGFAIEGEHTATISYTGDVTNLSITDGETEWKLSTGCGETDHKSIAGRILHGAQLLIKSRTR